MLDSKNSITILATSDVHGKYMPWDYFLDEEDKSGSMTQISTLIKNIRDKNTILIDTGDFIQGNLTELFKDSNPHPGALILNYLKYDVFNIGNHEFDFGMKNLNNFLKQVDAKVLGGNLYKRSGEQYFPSYTILEKNGIKIGVIGITTPMVEEFKKSTNIFDGLYFEDTLLEIKRSIEKIKNKVDVIIGAFHLGLENENNIPNTGVRDIAEACPDIDIILAGHMHKLHKSEYINGVLILEPDKYGTYVSKIDLVFEGKKLVEKKGNVISTKDYSSDKELEKKLLDFHNIARNYINQEVGIIVGGEMIPKEEIRGISPVQTTETPLTDLYKEAMLFYSKADVVSIHMDRDLGEMNNPIKRKDIAYNYTYSGGEVSVYNVTGRDLKTYMEWSAAYFGQTKYGDINIYYNAKRRMCKYINNDTFGGVYYKIDIREPEGSRIKEIKLLTGQNIKETDTIRLGMNEYRMNQLIAKGGPLEGKNFEKIYSTDSDELYGRKNGTIRNLVIKYIQEEKLGVYEAKTNNYWEIIGLNKNIDFRDDIIELINEGIIDLPSSEDSRYTNISAINIFDMVSKEEIKELSKKTNLNSEIFIGLETKGEFYSKLNKEIKKANHR